LENNFEKKVVDVSILSANLNNGSFIKDYFLSILQSTVLPNEIILVDDGSTDNSQLEIQEFHHLDYLRVVRLSKNLGFANALNYGIGIAKSKYIMRLDPDDFIKHFRIENQFEFLESNPGVDMIGSNVDYYHDNSAKFAGKSQMPERREAIRRSYSAGNHGIFHTSVMGKRSIFSEIGYRQEYFPAEDYDFFSRVIVKGYHILNHSDSYTNYRIHDNNLSDKHLRTTVRLMFQIRKEFFGKDVRQGEELCTYFHRLFYRKSLINIGVIKFLYLFIAALFRPKSVIKRIFVRSNA
jgi:glycosyltransferase involved in cell wall biosynthesis